MKYTKVRQPIVEGLFYPESKEEADKKVDYLLEKNSCPRKNGRILILPHGGWDYAGEYIAAGFNSLPEKKFSRVVIISNVHREFCDNIIIPEAEYFSTNGKNIRIDLDAINTIKRNGKKILVSNIPHMEENSIEIILPFISRLYPEAKIVPILLGKTIVSLVRNLKDIISQVDNDDTLIVISSNFSSYIKKDQAHEIGRQGISLTRNGKMAELVELTRTNKIQTCGAGAISSIILLGGYSEVEVLKEGLTPETPLSGGRATYYGSLIFTY